MKRNFYLQHQLMAMHDPRMQNLFVEERRYFSCALASGSKDSFSMMIQ